MVFVICSSHAMLSATLDCRFKRRYKPNSDFVNKCGSYKETVAAVLLRLIKPKQNSIL